MLYACSILVMRSSGRAYDIAHGAFVIEAVSADEANGKVLRAARKMYPAARGWDRHDVTCQPASIVITDPDEAILTGTTTFVI